MAQPLNNSAMDQLFVKARTVNGWLDTPVSDDQLSALYDLMKMGPTSANCCPARLVFVKSAEAKEKLLPYVSEGNQAKVSAAPVTVIIGTDYEFAEQLPKLFPHDLTAKTWFADPDVRDVTAFRNGTLQAGYLIMAARSLGLDCGPMSGFDLEGVDKEYFKDTAIKSNFICCLGHGSEEGLFERSPRLDFDEAAKIL